MRLEKLFAYEPWIDPRTMAPEKWVRYPARDGLTIPALLTLPPNAQSKRAPLVVVIHGGPNVGVTSIDYLFDNAQTDLSRLADRSTLMVRETGDPKTERARFHKPYEWVVYADEGHGFNKDENLFDFYGRVDRFLAKYLAPAAAAK